MVLFLIVAPLGTGHCTVTIEAIAKAEESKQYFVDKAGNKKMLLN